MKVIASASTDAKVDYMRSLGADIPFNYKTVTIPSVLEKHGPLNVYWDNVGGETLEHAIDYAGFHARIIVRNETQKREAKVEFYVTVDLRIDFRV